jgi:UDP-glucose 4-epimerase
MRQHKADKRAPVLVTGGAGFIGSHTVEALLAAGHPVCVYDDFSTGKMENLPEANPALEVVAASVLDHKTLRAAMHGKAGCIHLAAQVSAARSVEEPVASATRNILGFIEVLEAMRAEGVPRLVYASSAAVYGNAERLPLREDEILLPTNPYGLEKLVDEHYATLYERLHGTDSLGLRYFNVYGPRQDPSSPYSGVISKFIERLAADAAPTIFGDGRQTRDFIYVGDVAAANVAALHGRYRGVCNVATGGRVNLVELFETLKACTGAAVQLEFAAARAGDIRHSCGDATRLKRELGFSARRSLDEGLAELAAYVGAAPVPRAQARPRRAPRPLTAQRATRSSASR